MTLNFINAFKASTYNAKHTQNTNFNFRKYISFFKNPYLAEKEEEKNKFIRISVFRLFSWPAFGGPKNSSMYIHEYEIRRIYNMSCCSYHAVHTMSSMSFMSYRPCQHRADIHCCTLALVRIAARHGQARTCD